MPLIFLSELGRELAFWLLSFPDCELFGLVAFEAMVTDEPVGHFPKRERVLSAVHITADSVLSATKAMMRNRKLNRLLLRELELRRMFGMVTEPSWLLEDAEPLLLLALAAPECVVLSARLATGQMCDDHVVDGSFDVENASGVVLAGHLPWAIRSGGIWGFHDLILS